MVLKKEKNIQEKRKEEKKMVAKETRIKRFKKRKTELNTRVTVYRNQYNGLLTLLYLPLVASEFPSSPASQHMDRLINTINDIGAREFYSSSLLYHTVNVFVHGYYVLFICFFYQ